MKRLLNGFTMAEVLITIGILGVIAAMTLPSLQVDVQKHQIGPTLAKAVNTIESSAGLMLIETGTRNLKQACDSYEMMYYPQCLMKSGLVRLTNEPEIREFTNGDASVSMGQCVLGNDGISFCPSGGPVGGKSPNANLGNRYHGEFYLFYIDINGPKGPNKIAKDVFQVYLDGRGVVLPYGSLAWKDYMGNNSSWKEKCNIGENIVDAEYCAGSISDNAWNVKYNY